MILDIEEEYAFILHLLDYCKIIFYDKKKAKLVRVSKVFACPA